jgi:hypothetical protein
VQRFESIETPVRQVRAFELRRAAATAFTVPETMRLCSCPSPSGYTESPGSLLLKHDILILLELTAETGSRTYGCG